MKICNNCGSGNDNSRVICVDCGCSLKSAQENDSHLAEEFFLLEERKEKRRLLWQRIVMVLYPVLAVPLYVVCVVKEPVLWWMLFLLVGFCYLIYYLSVFQPKTLFILEHFMKIDHVEQVEPSDWWYLSNQIAGYLMWGLGIGILCYISIFS